jgi:hypothetical protein
VSSLCLWRAFSHLERASAFLPLPLESADAAAVTILNLD